ncbi:saccharopine dehydrogenase, partial [Pseudomonas chlororaphis]
RADAAQRLRQASLLDLSGQARFVTLLVQLDGHRDDRPITRSVLLGGTGNAALTGAMAAASALSVLEGEIPPGCHHAAQALPPAATLERLQRTSAISVLELLDVPIDHLRRAEEGSL